ncbi:MAG: metallophosphoesterase, partial [Bacillota bacterium]|nr:metallophosphoesterase [Bacillota bacterium]
MRALAVGLFSAGLALLGVALAGRQAIEVGPVEAEVRVVPLSRGETVLILPPLGEIAAPTHRAPLRLEVTLRNLDFSALEVAANGWSSSRQVIEELEPEARAALFLLLRRLFLVAAAGGALGGLWLTRRWKGLAAGALAGLAVVGALVVPAYLTYDLQAFSHPRYRGALEAAPWMISLAQRSLRQVDDLGRQLRLLGNNLTALFERANRLGALGAVPGDLRILHVSDIHNNPAALQLVAQVVQNFGADAVIDTGDLTDFGTALEAELPQKIRDLGVP